MTERGERRRMREGGAAVTRARTHTLILTGIRRERERKRERGDAGRARTRFRLYVLCKYLCGQKRGTHTYIHTER